MQKPPLNKIEEIALNITKGVGSVWSIFIHTILFVGAFSLVLFGIPFDRVLLVLTTILSLEAIYLSIFIQMSVNFQSRAIASVEKEIDEIAEDVEGIAEDVEEIQEDVEEIAEDVEEINKDIDEIQEDVEGIQENVEDIQEDVEGINKDIDEIQEDVEEINKDIDEIQEGVDEIQKEDASSK